MRRMEGSGLNPGMIGFVKPWTPATAYPLIIIAFLNGSTLLTEQGQTN